MMLNPRDNFRTASISFALIITMCFSAIAPIKTFAQNTVPPPYPVKRKESRRQWYADGRRAVVEAKALRQQSNRARNVILFVGDGMGISTVTAARILEGQLRGESGEENLLSFERLPYVALSRTYSVNQQTSDSAPTMTAIITGVKTKDGMLSVDQNAVSGDHTSVAGNELPSILMLAERAGLSTGVVSTARITHATPGACYAHTPEREWESDNNLSAEARADGYPDIARQLIEFPYGDGLEVALGGGRTKFLPRETDDPEYTTRKGERLDKRDLTREWQAKRKGSNYVWNKSQFDAIDPRRTTHLLGLFEPSHVKYEHDRAKDTAGEPSLSEMTAKAIDMLARNPRGYFLMVEGGRIDHAHHDGNAYRALTEAIELSNAVKTALSKINLRDTLVIVTADHSHPFSIGGYPTRGNDILGLTRENGAEGEPASRFARDRNGRPYTTLGYLNGPGAATSDKPRPDIAATDTTAPDYLQEARTPLGSETHGGEDVAIYAGGAMAHLIHGVREQNYIFHVMREALRFPRLSRSRKKGN
ncbi:MAG: alkaline phosphatase [Pyrinomonadaceae bacterium MAG19_C2-C3]|nr:alkaline phosphatase [Pyrinomonadaceae bacterium MAG19_C2-C3]